MCLVTRQRFLVSYKVWSIKIQTTHKLSLWLYYCFFLRILISCSKFFMPRPLKWGILGAHTLILSKDTHKYAGKKLFVDSPVLPILSISRNSWKAIFQHSYEKLWIELLYWQLVYLILEILAWEISNMK